MKYVTVAPAQAGAFLKAAGQLGLQVHLARVLPGTEVVGLYRGAHVEAFTLATLPPCPVFAVAGASRRVLRKLPGVKRVRAKDTAPAGPVYVEVA